MRFSTAVAKMMKRPDLFMIRVQGETCRHITVNRYSVSLALLRGSTDDAPQGGEDELVSVADVMATDWSVWVDESLKEPRRQLRKR